MHTSTYSRTQKELNKMYTTRSNQDLPAVSIA